MTAPGGSLSTPFERPNKRTIAPKIWKKGRIPKKTSFPATMSGNTPEVIWITEVRFLWVVWWANMSEDDW